jgi:NADH pyrophosphatase NudC (nudix superfamily)
MKHLSSHTQLLNQIERLKPDLVLFFTEEGIIVDNRTNKLLLPFTQTVKALELEIQSLYVNDAVVSVLCHLPAPTEHLTNLGVQIYPVKPLLAQLTNDMQQWILKAHHWFNWERQSRYCGSCGDILSRQLDTTEKKCLRCEQSFFPRFSPAVMVLIYKEDALLLARSPHFNPGVYSAVAGFIDVGETAEQAAHREVKEELGLEITNLEFFTTQSWPFPDSFMIAFKSRFAGGEVHIDEQELEDARWFTFDDLPELPSKASIARHLIDSVIKQR